MIDWLVKNDSTGWGIFHLLCGARQPKPPSTIEGAFDEYMREIGHAEVKWSTVVWRDSQLVCERCGGTPPAAVELMARALGVYDRYVKKEEGLNRIRAMLDDDSRVKKRKERYLEKFWKAVGIDPI